MVGSINQGNVNRGSLVAKKDSVIQKTLQEKDVVPHQPTAVNDVLPSQESLKKARVESLIKAQDSARTKKGFKPHGGRTYCNHGTAQTLKDLGMDLTDSKVGLAHPETKWPYSANLMARKLANSAKEKDGYWMEVDNKKAQDLANQGLSVVAAQRGKGHGHVATVRPEGYDKVKGDSNEVLINNIGKKNSVMYEDKCFKNSPVHYYVPRQDGESIIKQSQG